jgi:hypothetical protein
LRDSCAQYTRSADCRQTGCIAHPPFPDHHSLPPDP